MKTLKKTVLKDRRKKRIRGKVHGTSERPRLAVFCSLTHIYAQVLDDEKSSTLVSASDMKIKKGTKTERAIEIGKKIAELASGKKISTVVFDRGGKKYHGRVKALADAAREGGLKF